MALNNPEFITKLLRETDKVDQNIYKQILQAAEQKPIHLYEIGKLTKMLLLGSRYQVIFYAVFGIAYMGIIGQEKYKQLQDELTKIDTNQKYYEIKQEKIESKIQKLKVVAILFGLTSTLGLYVTSMMGKKIPKSIHLTPDNQFQLTFYSFFGFKRQLIAPLSDFTLYSGNSKLNKTIMMQYKTQTLSTIGTGISHSNLIRYLLNEKRI